jgi:hypothetical protein
MAKYRVETDQGTYEVETDEGAAPASPAAAPAPTSPPAMSVGGFGQALDMVKQSPMFGATSPLSFLSSKVPEKLNQIAGDTGKVLAEGLARPEMRKNPFNDQMYNARPIPPEAAAAAGFATSLAPDIAMTVGGPGVLEGSLQGPQFLGKWGARQVNNAAGIQPGTVARMSGRQNPTVVGENVGRKMVQEGAFGSEAGSTFDKTQTVMNKFGGDVKSAIDAIKGTGQAVSLDAETALKPLVDSWTEKAGAALQAKRAEAKPFEEIYTKLSQAAEKNGGQLGLDDLRAAMDEAGEVLGGLAKESPKKNAYSDLYAKLADVRDQMVSAIAQKAGSPQLRDALIKANEGYSRYSRLMPDIKKAAARASVGNSSVPLERNGIMNRIVDAAQPLFAKAAVKLGGAPAPAGSGRLLTPAVGSATEEVMNARKPRPIPLGVVRPAPRPLFRKAS